MYNKNCAQPKILGLWVQIIKERKIFPFAKQSLILIPLMTERLGNYKQMEIRTFCQRETVTDNITPFSIIKLHLYLTRKKN